jgi:serine/threonine protein kinase
MAALQHPNIVTVYDFGEATDDTHTIWLYFVMEFVDGTDLLHLLRSGTMGPDLCMRVVLAVCDALQFAHDHGIIHRDIKPANILVHRHGEVKVADFGLAKVMGAEIARQGASHAPLLTLTAISMGTPGYVAPETLQHGSQATDHRADIYAIGVLLYELLTHSIPLGSFELPSKARPDLQINPAVDEVVVRAMRPDPEARYQRASELSRDITAILSGQQTTRLPAGPSPAGSWRETAVRFVPAALAVSFALTDLEFYPRHPGNAFAWKVVATMFPSLFLASVGPREMVEDGGLLVRWFGLRPSVQMSVLSGLAWLALGVVCGFMVQAGLLQPGFVENLVYGIGWTGLMASIGIFCFIAFYRSATASQPS